MDSKQIAKEFVKVLDKKKAENIVAIEISELTVIADYFVIANGTSNTHVRSLTDDIEDAAEQLGLEQGRVEGRATGWILIDYGDVVVHLFTPDAREYYSLERLWSDAKQMDISDIVSD